MGGGQNTAYKKTDDFKKNIYTLIHPQYFKHTVLTPHFKKFCLVYSQRNTADRSPHLSSIKYNIYIYLYLYEDI